MSTDTPSLTDLNAVDVVLLDVEGTTTRIQFVYDVLFPYATEHLSHYLQTHQQHPELQQLREAIESEMPGQPAETTLRQWMAQDVKHPHLKTLQGWIWAAGYKDGSIKGHVYDDVPEAFRRWTEAGKRIAIYSSGSVLAQQLLFEHSTAGDLRPYISAYFDTAVGPKREPASYTAIAQQLNCSPNSILFLSDIAEELIAAQLADYQVRHIERSDNLSFKNYPPFCPLVSLTDLQ